MATPKSTAKTLLLLGSNGIYQLVALLQDKRALKQLAEALKTKSPDPKMQTNDDDEGCETDQINCGAGVDMARANIAAVFQFYQPNSSV